MTLSEFKAWLNGLCVAMDGPPNADQWKTILDEFGKIEGGVPKLAVGSRGPEIVRLENSTGPTDSVNLADVPQGSDPDDDPSNGVRYV